MKRRLQRHSTAATDLEKFLRPSRQHTQRPLTMLRYAWSMGLREAPSAHCVEQGAVERLVCATALGAAGLINVQVRSMWEADTDDSFLERLLESVARGGQDGSCCSRKEEFGTALLVGELPVLLVHHEAPKCEQKPDHRTDVVLVEMLLGDSSHRREEHQRRAGQQDRVGEGVHEGAGDLYEVKPKRVVHNIHGAIAYQKPKRRFVSAIWRHLHAAVPST
mmetsp:Transcript_51057/g.108472  ORF Transcript_51057/g.108472 Transcript_51057/m.108472 type:complete len:220 (-) Transcript_51057:662-1321(-)